MPHVAIVIGLSVVVLGADAACGGRSLDREDPPPAADVAPTADVPPKPEASLRAERAEPVVPPGVASPSDESADQPRTTGEDSDPTAVLPWINRMLRENCGECHAGGAAESDVGNVDDFEALIGDGLIVPFRSADSVLVQVMLDGSMPPPGVMPRPSPRDIARLARFIDNPNVYYVNP